MSNVSPTSAKQFWAGLKITYKGLLFLPIEKVDKVEKYTCR